MNFAVPYNTTMRACGNDILPDVSFEWAEAVSEENFNEIQRALFSIVSYAQLNGFSQEMDAIFSEVRRVMGIDDDEALLSAEIAAALEAECHRRIMSLVEDYMKRKLKRILQAE